MYLATSTNEQHHTHDVPYLLSPLELANNRACWADGTLSAYKFIFTQNDCLLGCMFTAVRWLSANAFKQQHFKKKKTVSAMSFWPHIRSLKKKKNSDEEIALKFRSLVFYLFAVSPD